MDSDPISPVGPTSRPGVSQVENQAASNINSTTQPSLPDQANEVDPTDPYALRGHKREKYTYRKEETGLSQRRHKKVKKYYNRQNALIDAYLSSADEEALELQDNLKNGGKVRFAVNASFVCNACLFVIQLYAAISTGSLALFATAADAFVGVSSSIMLRQSANCSVSNRWTLSAPLSCSSRHAWPRRPSFTSTLLGGNASRP